MIEAGRLRHLVSIEKRTKVRGPSGEVKDVWRQHCRCWAAIEPLSSRERFEGDQPKLSVTHRVIIRHRDGILGGMRVVSGNRVFDIEGVINRQERGFALELTCQEVVR